MESHGTRRAHQDKSGGSGPELGELRVQGGKERPAKEREKEPPGEEN